MRKPHRFGCDEIVLTNSSLNQKPPITATAIKGLLATAGYDTLWKLQNYQVSSVASGDFDRRSLKERETIYLFERQTMSDYSSNKTDKKENACTVFLRNGTTLEIKLRYCWYCGKRLIGHSEYFALTGGVYNTKIELTFGDETVVFAFAETATIDHVIPRSKGGSNKPNNKVTSCRSCNSSKRQKSIEEYRRYKAEKAGVVVFFFWGEGDRNV